MSISNISSLIQDFKEISEWKTFSESLHKLNIKLTSENFQLKEEIKHLKDLVQKTTPVLTGENFPTISTKGLLTTDEEAIAVCQLEQLRDLALQRPLTLEEAKRTEIFFKILTVLRNQPKTIVVKSKEVPTEQLLALAETNFERSE